MLSRLYIPHQHMLKEDSYFSFKIQKSIDIEQGWGSGCGKKKSGSGDRLCTSDEGRFLKVTEWII